MLASLLLVCLLWVPALCAFDHTAQTFFMPRSLALDVVHQNALSRYRINHAWYEQKEYEAPRKKAAFNLQTSYIYNNSVNRGDMAKYFSICSKKELVVDEQGNGDIGSGWLGIFAQDGKFNGTFSFRPERSVSGFMFNYHHDFSEIVTGVWLEAFLPIVEVCHDLNLTDGMEQCDLSDGGFSTIIEALNNPVWCFGKWSPRKVCKTGVDDLMIHLGYRFADWKRVHLDGFFSFLVPTNESPKSEFVFEPVVGSGGHFGLGGGLRMEAELCKGTCFDVNWFFDLQYRYLFSHTEKRSFDIKDKTWSRYLNFSQETAFPGRDLDLDYVLRGINAFTDDLSVRPGSSFDFLTFMHTHWNSLHFEMGYRYWWRDQEHVKLANCCRQKLGIVAFDDNVFFPEAQISDPWLTEPPEGQNDKFVEIKNEDLNLNVASHKTAHSHTLFGALSVQGRFLHHPAQFGIGGSFEFGERNSALDIWSIWVSASLGF